MAYSDSIKLRQIRQEDVSCDKRRTKRSFLQEVVITRVDCCQQLSFVGLNVTWIHFIVKLDDPHKSHVSDVENYKRKCRVFGKSFDCIWLLKKLVSAVLVSFSWNYNRMLEWLMSLSYRKSVTIGGQEMDRWHSAILREPKIQAILQWWFVVSSEMLK